MLCGRTTAWRRFFPDLMRPAQGKTPAAFAAIADHLGKLWDPRMSKADTEHAASGGEGSIEGPQGGRVRVCYPK